MKYWIKIDRFCAWVLFGGIFVYFISGYGMTNGIINTSLASSVSIVPIGRELKTGGYLAYLVRSRIADFNIEDSIKL